MDTDIHIATKKKEAEHEGEGAEQKEERLNLHGVFLHVMGDALGSLGAILTGLGIWLLPWSGRYYLDPICSAVISCIILSSSIPLVKRCVKILMQSVPETVDLDAMQQQLMKIEGVLSIHELHIWQLAASKIIGTVHMTCPNDVDFHTLATSMKKILHSHGVHATTIQPEFIEERATKESVDLPDKCTLLCDSDSCQKSLCCSPRANAASFKNKLTSVEDVI